ncbi:PREDICTED: protocadherin beta-14-like [Calidris pugnax]|uniref:protocadherin beta-14-like n=1 Tax=Calidris pugnax TaxID=198806 RepID=UPI00071DDB36|nr:PREDICTED: protocadherin beta-14-like [Calidris pugnax]
MAIARQVLGLSAFLCLPLARSEPMRYSVAEEAARGSLVGNVAEDAGLAPAQLAARRARLASEDGRQHFGLDPATGRLVVAERLDREELCGQSAACTLPFELVLANPLQFFRVEVAVEDINDHSPVFPEEQVTLRIPERSDPGLRFPLVGARDLDVGSNSIQAYSIAPQNEYFSVSFGNGDDKDIELVLEKALDREEQAEVGFSLIAVDGGSPPRSGTTQIHVVVLDANDNTPIFTQKLYIGQVLENTPEGSVVLRVMATDRDVGVNGNVTYQFRQSVSMSNSAFAIDPRTGEIKLIKTLDFEVAENHELSVQATDGGGLSAICKVLVEVVDVNDNAPELMVSSFTSVNGNITYQFRQSVSTSNSAFTIDPRTGEIKLIKTLDFEVAENHEFNVQATDGGGLSAICRVLVEVVDVNDNAPELVNDNAPMVLYPAQDSTPASSELVPVSAEAGYLITKVVAVDADSGQNSWLSYPLLRATDPGLFVVGAQSGEVRLKRPVTERDVVKQNLVVLVRDNGRPPLSATAALSALLLNDFSDVRLPHSSVATEDESDSLTTYLIISLTFVSLLFLASLTAFLTHKFCRRKDLKDGQVLYGTSNLQSDLVDAAMAGTLPHGYCYEISLTTGSGNSEFKFLKPIVPSLPPQQCTIGRSTNDGQDFPHGSITAEDMAADNHGMLSAGQFNSLSFN